MGYREALNTVKNNPDFELKLTSKHAAGNIIEGPAFSMLATDTEHGRVYAWMQTSYEGEASTESKKGLYRATNKLEEFISSQPKGAVKVQLVAHLPQDVGAYQNSGVTAKNVDNIVGKLPTGAIIKITGKGQTDYYHITGYINSRSKRIRILMLNLINETVPARAG